MLNWICEENLRFCKGRLSGNEGVFEHLLLLLAVTCFSVFLKMFAVTKYGQIRGRKAAFSILSYYLSLCCFGNWKFLIRPFLKEIAILLIIVFPAPSSMWHIVGVQCLLSEYMQSLPKLLCRYPRESLGRVKKLSILTFSTGHSKHQGIWVVVILCGYIMDSSYTIKGHKYSLLLYSE